MASTRRAVLTVAGAVAVSWIGFLVHNAADLPVRSLVGPETLVPSVVYLALLGGWLLPPLRRPVAPLLYGWGWLNAIGGGLLSVLPLPWWPYRPEQTVYHYAMHAVYAALQVPLLVSLTNKLRGASASQTAAVQPRNGRAF